MDIQEQVKGAVRVLRPSAPLLGPDAEKLKGRATQAAHAALGKIVIDAAAVSFVDSRGLEVLVELSEELAKTGQVLKLAAAGDTLREVLELTELTAMVEHYEDVNSAVRSFL